MAEQKTLNLNEPMIKAFNVNEGVPEKVIGKEANEICRLPSSPYPRYSIDDYASEWATIGMKGMISLAKDFQSSMPPYAQSFGRMSYMPGNTTSQLGILQWPGLPPETLQKLAREMVGPNLIFKQRFDDIIRYSQISRRPWFPGWRIHPIDDPNTPFSEIDRATRKEILEAESFIMNSGYGEVFANPVTRDRLLRKPFPKFLIEVIQDSLIYDGIAIWLDTNNKGEIESYCQVPAGKIRLLARPDQQQFKSIHQGELNFFGATNWAGKQPTVESKDPPFAVTVDETNNIIQSFTRKELVWYTRNSRVDAEIGGYGHPEFEIGLALITGFNNGIQFNADLFDKNSIPKGILAIKGNFTQRQFDALGRIWDNLQRGHRTDWTLPAMQLSEKGGIEVINLEPLRKEPVYYNNMINLFMGALCTLYGIPPHRIGYKISGTSRDPRPDTDKGDLDEDVGLPALLTHLEVIINDYLIQNRWPHLRFSFSGKTPKEDARLYEVSLLTKTVDERRRLVGDPPLSSLVPKDAGELEQFMARVMGSAPVDPTLAAVYQTIIAAAAKAGAVNAELGLPMSPMDGGGGGSGSGSGSGQGGPGASGLGDIAGARMQNKKDPHKSEQHGHQSGVRRRARDEANKTPAGRNQPKEKSKES